MRVTLTERVPGSFSRPNTRKTEICLLWGLGAGERTLYLREHLDYDDSPFDERLCGYLPLVELPELAAPTTLEELREALEERFDAHPLANQLPECTAIVEHALSHCDPLDVVRVSARFLCPAGVARGFAAALAGSGQGPFRSAIEPIEIKRLARACMVLQLGLLDLHGSYGPWAYWAEELLEKLPAYPEGKHASHDGGQHDAVCLEYDRLLSVYLREAALAIERALALEPEKLDARSKHLSLPTDVWTAEQAVAKVHQAFFSERFFWESDLADSLEELVGQPFTVVRPVVSGMLAGKIPVSLPEGSRVKPEVLSAGRIILYLLRALWAADLDLRDEIASERDKKAQQEAERAAREAELREKYPAEPSSPRPPRLRDGSALVAIAIGLLLLGAALFSGCIRGC